ncbi:hypothetical protein E2C01_081778 [Portunus trituberculatus]|uniref:Uncharacterized protein n=1 Tax=Portunus trituberculatus TaxID=210409 RepID=A0A5B7IWT0_PORTR|nr:hypothetical protein [Portunus trituberculatus]
MIKLSGHLLQGKARGVVFKGAKPTRTRGSCRPLIPQAPPPPPPAAPPLPPLLPPKPRDEEWVALSIKLRDGRRPSNYRGVLIQGFCIYMCACVLMLGI